MERDTKIQNNFPPDSASTTDRNEQQPPQVILGQFSKKSAALPPSEVIHGIRISEDEQGVTIHYAQDPLTEKAIEQLKQHLASKEVEIAVKTLKSETDVLVTLEGVRFLAKHDEHIPLIQVTLDEAYTYVLHHLDKSNIYSLKTIAMKEVEGKDSGRDVQKPPVITKAPLFDLHQALEKAGAYEKIKNEKHRQVLEEYLTTEKPMVDLRNIAGVKTVDAVNHIIHRHLNKVFSELRPEVQQEYGGSANEAIKRKASTQLQTATSRERIKKGVEGRVYTKPTGRPKGRTDSQPRKARELSDTHKQRMSESLKRHHQERKVQQQIPPHEEQTIFDFTKSSQEH